MSLTVLDDLTPLQEPEERQPDPDGEDNENITQVPRDKVTDLYDNFDGITSHKSREKETDACYTDHLQKPEDKQTDSDGKGDGNIAEKLTDKNARSDDDGYVNTEKKLADKNAKSDDHGYVNTEKNLVEKLDVPGDDGHVSSSEGPVEIPYVTDDDGYVTSSEERETIQTAAAGYITPIPEPRDGKVDPDGYLISSPAPTDQKPNYDYATKQQEIKTEQPEDATPQAPTEEKPIYDYTTKSQEIKNGKLDHNDVTTPDADPKKPVYDYATTQQIPIGDKLSEPPYLDDVRDQRPRQNDVLCYVDSRKGHRNGQPVPPIVSSMKQPIDDDVYEEIDDVRRSQTELRTDYHTPQEGSAILMVPSLTPLGHQTIVQRLKTFLRGNLTIVSVILAVIVIASLIGVIIALIVIPKPPPTEAPTTSNQPESSTVETTSYPPGYKYCQHNTPCKNSGTCIDLPGFKYVCVCPKCGCSTAKPFGDCIIDKDTICKTEDLPPGKLVPHPYLCIKFYICHPNVTLRSEQYVYKYADGNHVFNPATELSDYPKNVACAVQEVVELCADITCANGGTCQDTASGYMCECAPGYKGRKCEIVK